MWRIMMIASIAFCSCITQQEWCRRNIRADDLDIVKNHCATAPEAHFDFCRSRVDNGLSYRDCLFTYGAPELRCSIALAMEKRELARRWMDRPPEPDLKNGSPFDPDAYLNQKAREDEEDQRRVEKCIWRLKNPVEAQCEDDHPIKDEVFYSCVRAGYEAVRLEEERKWEAERRKREAERDFQNSLQRFGDTLQQIQNDRRMDRIEQKRYQGVPSPSH